MMNTVRRTALRIITRLQTHPNLKLAVMWTRGCVRTFDASTEDIAGLGKHYRLVGIYDGRASLDDIDADLNDVLEQIKKEQG